jgi:two-component system, NtrC family, sensor kinase
MSDVRCAGELDSLREGIERLAQLAEDLAPSHQALVQEVLKTCCANVEALQIAVEERQQLLDRIQKDQELLAELARSLERERESQQSITQHTDAHLAYLDPEFNFVRVNPTYARGSGHQAADLIGHNHFDLFPHAENQAIFERVRDTGESVRFRAKPFEFVDQPERGVTYWDWSLVPDKDSDGQLRGLVFSLLDVTETVRAQQALREERDRAQSYLDMAGAIIVAIGSDETVTLINRKGCEILGYEEKEIVGKNWFDTFIPQRERDRVRRVFGMTMTGEMVASEQFENPVLTRSGEEKIISWHNALLRDGEGAVLGSLSSGEDITERTRAQQQILQQHQFLQHVLDSLPHPFLVINARDRTVEIANSAALAGGTLGNQTCYSLGHGRDRPCDAEDGCPLHEVVRSRRPAVLEHVHVDKGGRRQDVEVHAYPIVDAEGNVVQMIEYCLDITERKRAEQALRDSEEKLRALFDILPIGVSVLDSSRNIRLANPALSRILRLSPAQLLSGHYESRTYLRADGTEMPPGEFPSNRAFSEQRLVRDVEICVIPEKAEPIWTSVSAAPLPSDDWRIIVTTIDITARKQAEAALSRARDELEMRVEERTAELQALNRSLSAEIAERQRAEEELRASEERFRQLAENTEDLIILAEPDTGRLLYVSPAYSKLFGRPSTEVPEKVEQFWADVHPDDLPRIPQGRLEAWLGQEVEFRVNAPGGVLRWIRVRAFPVQDQKGQTYRIVGIASDITEEKEAFAALIGAEQLAIAGRMAASLAHEINNPLQAAIGCLDLSVEQLDQGKDPCQHLQVTAEALERASRVVAQLRALHYPINVEAKEASDLNALLENMLILVQKRCLDQQVEVDWQAAPNLPRVLLMPDAMQQVFLNLLLNALDAMPEGGRLQVSTHRGEAPAGVLVRFSDSGRGIPSDRIEHVFEPFHSTKPNSLGLGLFISHNIVQEHGGQIEIHSQEGAGTTFSVWLPLPNQGTSE